MKKKVGVLAFIFAIILSLNFISASVAVGNPSHEIDLLYGPGDAITGWVNISLNNEPTGSILKSSFGESISLIDLIRKVYSNSGFVKNCDTVECVSGYNASNPATSKTINLNENESVLIGFNISGNAANLLTTISDFTFNLTSNNPETEKLPLAIDILNDGENEWVSYVPSDNFGSENKGCFGISTGLAYIAQISYCERIRLSKTPEVELGAYIKGNTAGIDFSMKIENVDGFEHGSCTTNAATGSGIIERVSCSVPSFSVSKDSDYFVCIRTTNTIDANKFKISIEEDSNKCGFSSETGSYEGSYNYDFEIFARPKMYAGNINFTLNDDELINARSSMRDIEGYLEGYISDVYGDNCSRGCIIPVKIFSGVGQQIVLSNTYVVDPYIISYIAGISTTTDKFYDLNETPALINAGFQKLYLGEAGFRVPLENGDQTFSLTLNNSLGEQVLFTEQVNVGEVPGIKSLTPNKTGKYPTKFTVILNDSTDITKYMWNFGDGQIQNTTKGEVTHTYNAVGSYILRISLLDLAGTVISSKEFNIDVVPASEIVPTLLIEAELGISQIKLQIQNLSQFEQRAVNYSLKFNQLEASITRLKTSASQASSEAQFETILGELLGMKIPQAITKTAYSEGISFYPEGNNIDLNILKQIGGGDYEANKEEQYKEAILAWEEANINTQLIYGEISAIYPDYQEPFLRTFDIRIAKSGNESVYIVIKDMENIFFQEDYSQKKEGGYYYIDFDNPEEHIVFSTTENVDFINLPMFISPPISQLSLVEWTTFTKEGQLKKWVVFSIIAILIFLGALVVWIILQIWYKRKYESYLFKNRNNLYNLVTYIENEKRKGTSERDMADKLRKAGWNSEQIRYALRKYSGKRTGMPEIPIGMIKIRKFFKEKKKTNNSEKK